MANKAKGASTIGNGVNQNGEIITAPGRDGKVLLCSGTDESDCFAAPEATVQTPCLQ